MAADNWGQYGHSSHNKRSKGGKGGDVVLKMNWTYELVYYLYILAVCKKD